MDEVTNDKPNLENKEPGVEWQVVSAEKLLELVKNTLTETISQQAGSAKGFAELARIRGASNPKLQAQYLQQIEEASALIGRQVIAIEAAIEYNRLGHPIPIRPHTSTTEVLALDLVPTLEAPSSILNPQK